MRINFLLRPFDIFTDGLCHPKSTGDMASIRTDLFHSRATSIGSWFSSVYKDLPGSRLKEIIAKISGQQKRTGITLEKIVPLPRNQVDGDTIVYRVHEGDVAEVTSRFTPAKRNRRLDSKMK